MRVEPSNLFVGLDISSSGMGVQRSRMNVIANNIANINTTRDDKGRINPYRRRQVIFKHGAPEFTGTAKLGIRVDDVVMDNSEFKKQYKPGHPDADKDGYVLMPNVDLPVEMVDMMEATRAYEANITAMEATKGMINRTLRLLA